MKKSSSLSRRQCIFSLFVVFVIFLRYSFFTLNYELNHSIFRSSPCKPPNLEFIKQMSIVYTWVNGSLPCYQTLRAAYGGKFAVNGSRDRTIGELFYSLRSLRQYMPWHQGMIYLVTPGHIPIWLNRSHPRIRVIHQNDLIRNETILPTFNTNVIEQFLYRIPNLTSLFFHFNDDYFLTDTTDPLDFFTCNGAVKVFQEKNIIQRIDPSKRKGIWISSVYETQQQMNRILGVSNDRKFLKHAPYIYSRQGLKNLQTLYKKPLEITLVSKFRSKFDMNLPLLYFYYMLEKGQYDLAIPTTIESDEIMKETMKLFVMNDNNIEQLESLLEKVLRKNTKIRILVLNDNYKDMRIKDIVLRFLSTMYLNPSEFEKTSAKESETVLSFYNDRTCERDLIRFPVLQVDD